MFLHFVVCQIVAYEPRTVVQRDLCANCIHFAVIGYCTPSVIVAIYENGTAVYPVMTVFCVLTAMFAVL